MTESVNQDPAIRCPACGYYLKAITRSVCPECGGRFALVRHADSGGMRPADWFTVGTRLIGLWFLIQFVGDIRTLLDITAGWFTPQRTPMTIYYGAALEHVLIGSCLLFWAEQIASIVFKPSQVEGRDHGGTTDADATDNSRPSGG